MAKPSETDETPPKPDPGLEKLVSPMTLDEALQIRRQLDGIIRAKGEAEAEGIRKRMMLLKEAGVELNPTASKPRRESGGDRKGEKKDRAGVYIDPVTQEEVVVGQKGPWPDGALREAAKRGDNMDQYRKP